MRVYTCTHSQVHVRAFESASHNPTRIPSRSLNGNVKCDSGISTVLLVSVLFMQLKWRRGGEKIGGSGHGTHFLCLNYSHMDINLDTKTGFKRKPVGVKIRRENGGRPEDLWRRSR